MSLVGPHVSGQVPGPRSREAREAQQRIFYPGLTHGSYPIVASRKERWLVEDVDGNVFVDLASSSASVPFGAGRTDIVAAVEEQLVSFGNEDSHALTHPLMTELAERLLAVSPDGLTRVDIALNGTEAIETAVRVMRRATGRPVVIGFHGGYHGESSTTAGLGAEHAEISMGLRGLGGGFVHVPYPHTYRSPFTSPRPGGTGDSTVDYLRDHVLFHVVDPGEVAGVVIEPVLGSGGVVIPDKAFWDALAMLCREHDWLLCLDEVKTGFGRTGELFASDLWGLRPDLVCLGKAMGGGVMPIGAVLGTERVLGGFDDLSTGSTWSWLPASCAAALATLDIFEREPILENVRALHSVGIELLAPLTERFSQVGDVRVQGCFMAIELVTDAQTKERAPDLQKRVAEAALQRGVLVDSSTTSLNIQPSLVMPPDDLRAALRLVADAVASVAT
jgi:4-aminobutyrate aminotransferase-like enzyme